jgi:hypothetical protein
MILYFLNNDGKISYAVKNDKAIPVRVPWGCETSWLQHFLDNWLTDGGEVVRLTRRPSFTHRMIPGTHFSSRLSRHQGHIEARRIRSIENPMTSSGIPLVA